MRLVSPDVVSKDEAEIAQLLAAHPIALHRLTLLLNHYRALVELCGETLKGDFADISISLAKYDQATGRVGIPLLETTQDWMDMWDRVMTAQEQENAQKEANKASGSLLTTPETQDEK